MPKDPSLVTYQTRLLAALVRRKHEPMPPIEVVLPLSELIDTAFCESVSEDLYKDGRRWEIRKATPDLWQMLPLSGGLYMFVLVPELMLNVAHPERSEKLRYALYVGKAGSRSGFTSNLRSRYKAEYRHYVSQDPELLWSLPTGLKRREDVLRRYLNLHPLEYWYLEISEHETIDRMEKSLIKLLNPPLNLQGKIKLKPVGKAVPAFTRGQ
jgi:hypothetical protein